MVEPIDASVMILQASAPSAANLPAPFPGSADLGVRDVAALRATTDTDALQASQPAYAAANAHANSGADGARHTRQSLRATTWLAGRRSPEQSDHRRELHLPHLPP